MLDWLVQADEPAKWLAAVAAGLGALGWILHRLFRAARRGFHTLRDFATKASRVLDLADHEFQPNSGSSMVDKVNALVESHDNLTIVVDGLSDRLDELTGTN